MNKVKYNGAPQQAVLVRSKDGLLVGFYYIENIAIADLNNRDILRIFYVCKLSVPTVSATMFSPASIPGN
jgi:hypothetical protein